MVIGLPVRSFPFFSILLKKIKQKIGKYTAAGYDYLYAKPYHINSYQQI